MDAYRVYIYIANNDQNYGSTAYVYKIGTGFTVDICESCPSGSTSAGGSNTYCQPSPNFYFADFAGDPLLISSCPPGSTSAGGPVTECMCEVDTYQPKQCAFGESGDCGNPYVKVMDAECGGTPEIRMFEGNGDNEGTEAERVKACSEACLRRQTALSGSSASWVNFDLQGFIVQPSTGRCFCEQDDAATCTQSANGYDRYNWIGDKHCCLIDRDVTTHGCTACPTDGTSVNYKFIRNGECAGGNEIRLADVTGSTQEEKAANCASACLSRGTPYSGHSWSGKEDWIIPGFLIRLDYATCWCETPLSTTCSTKNPEYLRYDFTSPSECTGDCAANEAAVVDFLPYIKMFDGECGGSEIRMFEGNGDNDGTEEERVKACSEACLRRQTALSGSWVNFDLQGFIVSSSGRCYCEAQDISTCTQTSNSYDRYDWIQSQQDACPACPPGTTSDGSGPFCTCQANHYGHLRYDFTDKNSLADWQAYATEIGGSTSSFTAFGPHGLYIYPGNGWLQLPLPNGYDTITIKYGNTHTAANVLNKVRLCLCTTTGKLCDDPECAAVQTLSSYQILHHTMIYTYGQVLLIQETEAILYPDVVIDFYNAAGCTACPSGSESAGGAVTECTCQSNHFQPAKCKDGWAYISDRCVKLFTSSPLSWSDAKQFCINQGGELAIPKDAADNTAMFNLGVGGNDIWIGVNDITTEGTYKTSLEASLSYTNWASNEPSNSGGNEDCALMWSYKSNGEWNDATCSNTYGYLCEEPVRNCPTGWTYVTDRCVQLFKSALSWSDAKQFCIIQGGELAIPKDAADNTAMFNLGVSGNSVWIGVNDITTEGTYKTSSEASVSYTNWASNEPSGGSEDCAHMWNHVNNGQWNDASCSNLYWYLCELSYVDLICWSCPSGFISAGGSATECTGNCAANSYVNDVTSDEAMVAWDPNNEVFDGSSTFYNMGTKTINPAHGFTIVLKADFGAAVSWERIFNFNNNPTDRQFAFYRDSTTSQFYITLWGSDGHCNIGPFGNAVAGTTHSVFARFKPGGQLDASFDGTSWGPSQCSKSFSAQTYANTLIGKSEESTQTFFSGTIAGLYFFNRFLSDSEAQLVLDQINTGGIDGTCQACPANAQSVSGAVVAWDPNNEVFDGSSTYYNLGTLDFNIAALGFTAVTSVKFSEFGSYSTIWDFSDSDGNSANNNIRLLSGNNVGEWIFEIREGASQTCYLSAGTIALNTWYDIIARYMPGQGIFLKVNNNIYSYACSSISDRTSTRTYIGKSFHSSLDNFKGEIAGLYTYNRFLSDFEAQTVLDGIETGARDHQECGCDANYGDTGDPALYAKATSAYHIDGGGWKLVRRVKAGTTWHPATDHLAGTALYGTYTTDEDSDSTFSIPYYHLLHDTTEFLFATGDGTDDTNGCGSYWLIATLDQIGGIAVDQRNGNLRGTSDYSYAARTFKSGTGRTSAKWYNRRSKSEDPHITIYDWGAEPDYEMYLGDTKPEHYSLLQQCNGMNVFIRTGYTTNQCTACPAGATSAGGGDECVFGCAVNTYVNDVTNTNTVVTFDPADETFDGTSSSVVDLGTTFLDHVSNGGFTAVAKIKASGSCNWCVIWELGIPANGIVLQQNEGDAYYRAGYAQYNSWICEVQTKNTNTAINYGSWDTVVVRWLASGNKFQLIVNDQITETTCSSDPVDAFWHHGYIGGSGTTMSDLSLLWTGSIAGLYIYDQALTDSAYVQVLDQINTGGIDGTCQVCPPGSHSSGGAVEACHCDVNYFRSAGGYSQDKFEYIIDEPPHSWQEAYDLAIAKNKRLPTTAEMIQYCTEIGGLFYNDIWVPVGTPDITDGTNWVQCGGDGSGNDFNNAIASTGLETNCGVGYVSDPGDISGWGQISSTGSVQSSYACGLLCDSNSACNSYEYSTTSKICNLNTSPSPSSGAYLDYVFCRKIDHTQRFYFTADDGPCQACPAGSSSTGGLTTECTLDSCAANEYVALGTLVSEEDRLFTRNCVSDGNCGTDDGYGNTIQADAQTWVDLGEITYNTNTNGGFTLITKMQFTGPYQAYSSYERIFASASAMSSNTYNIELLRHGTNDQLYFFMSSDGVSCLKNDIPIAQDTPYNIIWRYDKATNVQSLILNDVYYSVTCPSGWELTDRTITHNFLGKPIYNDAYFHGTIWGLHVWDRYLHDYQAQHVLDNIVVGAADTILDDPKVGVCTACPAGSESPGGDVTSCSCVGGYYRAAVDVDGVTTYTGPCTSCDPGYTSLASEANTGGPDVCFYDCPAGQYVDSGTTCVDCPTDYTSAGGIPDASHCYYDCPAGEYAGTGASCLTCPVPFTSLASSGSVEDCKCGAGTYLDGSLCTGCPSDSTSPFGSTSVDACACAPGFTGPKESCAACNPGYYKSTAGSEACAQCDAALHESTSTLYGFTSCSCKEGYFRNTNDLCEACVENEYKDHVGNDDCTECTTNSETAGTGASAANQCLCSKGYENTEANTESMPSCHACDLGEYKESASNILACVDCPTDSLTLHTASFTVTDCQCVAGHEGLILTDTDTCADCDTGTFKSNTGTQDCGACPTGATSPSSSTASTDCTCTQTGYTGPNGGPCECAAGFTGENCDPCGTDTYKSTTGDAACSPCPTGSTSGSGSTANTDCICKVGFTGLSGGPCNACEEGKFKPTLGSDTCTNCPLNMISPSGSDAMEDCEAAAGYYGHYSTTSSQCPPNSNSMPGATDVSGCTCNVGYTGPNGGPCQPCLEGKYKATQGSDGCTSCGGMAFYSPEASDSSDDCVCALGYTGNNIICDSCNAGTYKAVTGSVDCTPCDSDASSPSASTAASDCDCNIGYFGDGHTTCDACGAGTYQDVSGSTDCKDCTANSNSAPGSDESTDCVCNAGYAGVHGGPCVVCAAGQYEDTATHICENCPDNSHSSSGSTLTDCLCNAGYTGPDGGSCSACDVGEYKDLTGSSACLSCHTQATSPAGSTSSGCACLPGHTGDGVSCSECEAGKFKDTTDNVVCTPCPDNSQSTAAATVCLCNVGFTGPADSCSQCGAGTFKPTAGTDTCTGCPENTHSPAQSDDVTDCVCNAGYTGSDGLACSACGTGKYKPLTGSATCTNCPSSSASPAASTAETDCVCNAGYGGDDGGPCTQCLSGTYEDTTSNTCLSCPPHTNSNAGSDALIDCTCNKGYTGPDGTTCTECSVNRYKNTTGSADCTPCTNFSTSPAASDDVSDCVCNSGYHHAGDGSCDLECAAGYEAGPHELQCLQCPNGKYKTTGGDHSCANCMDNAHHTELAATSIDACICNHGFYKSNDGQSCNACETGKFNNQAGEGQCFDCFSDTSGSCVSATGTQTECPDLCQAPAGYQVTASGVNLEPCPANTYNDGSFTTCQTCPSPSTYTSATGSTSVSDCICQPGYYRDNGVCTACAQGAYKSETGDAACDLCTATDTNTNTLATAATSVSDCLCIANYELRDGSCQACPAGGAKHIIGNDACIDCTDFATLADNGVHAASSCLCDPGYTGNHLGCSACLQGQYKPTSGPDSCSDCVEHATTATTASDSISDCYCPPPLWEDGDPGPTDPSGSCVNSCDPGTFKGESACENCVEGTYKPDTGPHACTPCLSPRNASAAGSDSANDCSCHAGDMALAGEHAVIETVGGYSEEGLSTDTCSSSCTLPMTGKRLKSLQLTSGVSITASINGIVVFKCTTDCDTFGTVDLHALPGPLQLTIGSGTATVTTYTRKTLTFQNTPAWLNAVAHAQAESVALSNNLKNGDFIFNTNDAVFVTDTCTLCAPNLICAPFIT